MEKRRKFQEPRLLLASGNPGKIREMGRFIEPFGIEVLSAADYDIPEPDETEDTYEGNSRLKALYYSQATGLPALADDSGLCVNALDGAPGVFSARWGGPEKDTRKAMTRIFNEMGDSKDRSAYFCCSLTLAWPDGHMESFEGKVEGSIAPELRGENGFGYDPIFIPNGYEQTFSEMDPQLKLSFSHRAQALKTLIDHCFAP